MNEENKKKNIGVTIAKVVVITFCVVMILLATGVASYNLTMKYYEVTAGDAEADTILDIVGDVTADEISRNIIYSYDSKTEMIKAVVLEVLNTNTNNLDYITIPVNSEFTISNQVYQRMCAAGADAPQIIRLEMLNEYFKNDKSYEYGILLLEDCLGIDIGYYTAFDNTTFDQIFMHNSETDCFEISPTTLTEANRYAGDNDIEGMIKDKCDEAKSNLKVKVRTKYADTFSKVKPELIYYYKMEGSQVGDSYSVDKELAKTSYETILASPKHKIPQSEANMIPSEGLNIVILNGTGITGLAAKTQALLAEQGLTIVNIGDNPELVEKTTIFVSKQGMGTDLLYNFNDAKIKVKELDEGVDILIVLGKNDADILDR